MAQPTPRAHPTHLRPPSDRRFLRCAPVMRLAQLALLLSTVHCKRCCHEASDFWDSLDDPAKDPRGSDTHQASVLTRLCDEPASDNRMPLCEQVCAGAQTLRAPRPSTLGGIAPALPIAPSPESCRGSRPRVVPRAELRPRLAPHPHRSRAARPPRPRRRNPRPPAPSTAQKARARSSSGGGARLPSAFAAAPNLPGSDARSGDERAPSHPHVRTPAVPSVLQQHVRRCFGAGPSLPSPEGRRRRRAASRDAAGPLRCRVGCRRGVAEAYLILPYVSPFPVCSCVCVNRRLL